MCIWRSIGIMVDGWVRETRFKAKCFKVFLEEGWGVSLL